MTRCIREELNVAMQNCRGFKMIMNKNLKGLSDAMPTAIHRYY